MADNREDGVSTSWWIIPRSLIPFRYPGVNIGPYSQEAHAIAEYERLHDDTKMVVHVAAKWEQVWP